MQFKTFSLCAMIGLGGMCLQSVQADEIPLGAHISTSGMSTLEVEPDQVTIVVEVNATDPQVATAKQKVDQRVAKYMDFLAAQQVDKKEINAANLQTRPQYDYSKAGKASLKGYTAERLVTIKLTQLDKLNTLLDGALKEGLNEIRSITFGVNDPVKYRDEVRQKAIQNAISNAQALAKGFGVQLGSVYSIRYQVNTDTPPMPRAVKLLSSNISAADTYHQEKISFNDEVEAVFSLKP